jgi:hypothetical protein
VTYSGGVESQHKYLALDHNDITHPDLLKEEIVDVHLRAKASAPLVNLLAKNRAQLANTTGLATTSNIIDPTNNQFPSIGIQYH